MDWDRRSLLTALGSMGIAGAWPRRSLAIPAMDAGTISLDQPPYRLREGREFAVETTAILQTAMDALAARGGGVLRVPPGEFFTNRGIVHRSNVHLLGAGESATSIRNIRTNNDLGIGGCATILLGTYGPAGARTGVEHEAGYPVRANREGATVLSLMRPADAANFKPGSIVGLEGGTIKKPTLPQQPNEVNEVVSVRGGTVVLRYPIQHDLVVNNAQPLLRVLNTGQMPGIGRESVPGTTGFVATNALISDITLICDSTYMVCNLSCYKSGVARVKLIGGAGLVGNPVARSTFDQVTMQYRIHGSELAYYSHNCTFTDCTWQRVDDLGGNAACAVWDNAGEGAFNNLYQNCKVIEYGDTRGAPGTVQLAERSRWIGGSLNGTRNGQIAFVLGSGGELSGVTIRGQRGIAIGANTNTIVENCDVGPTPAGYHGIVVPSYSRGARIRNVNLGGDGRSAADRIQDMGKGTQATVVKQFQR